MHSGDTGGHGGGHDGGHVGHDGGHHHHHHYYHHPPDHFHDHNSQPPPYTLVAVTHRTPLIRRTGRVQYTREYHYDPMDIFFKTVFTCLFVAFALFVLWNMYTMSNDRPHGPPYGVPPFAHWRWSSAARGNTGSRSSD